LNLNNQVENFGRVTFNGGTVQTGTGFFIAENSITANPATTSATMNGNLSLGVSPAYFIVSNGVAEPDLIINSAITGVGIIKQGQGTLSLAGINTHSGSTFAQEGILQADNNSAFGTLTGNTIVADGATIRLGGIDGMAEAMQLSGTGFQGTNGALQVTVGGTMFGNVFLSSPATINVTQTGALSVDSIISGTGPLTKTGPGNLFLGGVTGGTGNNSYSGGSVVSAGTLYLSKNQNVVAAPGNLTVGPAAASAPATARWSRSGTMTAGAIATVHANSLLDLNGNNQTLAQLILNDGGDAQTGAGTLSFPAGGSVTVGTLNPLPAGLRASASISGKLALPTLDYLTFNVGPYGLTPLTSDPELDITAAISGGGNIIKNGAGAMRLSGANTFNDAPPYAAGDLYVYDGTVIAASSGALGGPAGWTLVYNGARLALVGNITINNETLYLNSTNPIALDNPGGNNTWTGPITLARQTGINVNQDWSLVTSGVISGLGGLTKSGPGILSLSGSANNTYGGNAYVNEGVLLMNKPGFVLAVPHDLIIGSGQPGSPATIARHLNHDQVWGSTTVNRGGLLDVNGFDEYSADLTLNGGGDVQTGGGNFYLAAGYNILVNPGGVSDPATITGRLGLFPGSHTFLVTNGIAANGQFDLNIPAVVFQSSTAASIVKAGNGRMRLGGTNTYSGTTTVGSGVLAVDGSQPQSPITVQAARLEGSGIVGVVGFTGSAGTQIAPGSSPGILTCSNFNANALGGGAVEIELNGGLPGSGYDQLNIRGSVNLSNLVLTASLNSGSVVGQTFRIIDNDGTDAVTNTFTGLPQGKKVYLGGELFQISYTGGTGNDVVLTRLITPPPPTLTIERVLTNSVRLIWATNNPPFSLQANTNLTATNWVAALPLPTVVGTNNIVTNTTTSGETFYRLINP